MTRSLASAVLAAACLASTGCYTYIPVESPQPGMEVRARLKTEAAVRRSQGMDDPIVRVDGTIVESSPEALSLDILIARSSSAFQDVVMRDTVRLETADIQSLLVRKFSPSRTALFSVGLGAAAVGIILGIDQVVGGTGDNGGGGTPTLRATSFGGKSRTAWVGVGLPIR